MTAPRGAPLRRVRWTGRLYYNWGRDAHCDKCNRRTHQSAFLFCTEDATTRGFACDVCDAEVK